mmetsp:Transcript_117329/g.373815  ORF Transcript_117329/g.373815 Transcript_117329/m.373815 type:complete len:242 (-) Transcript_117329:5860-6585(-)
MSPRCRSTVRARRPPRQYTRTSCTGFSSPWATRRRTCSVAPQMRSLQPSRPTASSIPSARRTSRRSSAPSPTSTSPSSSASPSRLRTMVQMSRMRSRTIPCVPRRVSTTPQVSPSSSTRTTRTTPRAPGSERSARMTTTTLPTREARWMKTGTTAVFTWRPSRKTRRTWRTRKRGSTWSTFRRSMRIGCSVSWVRSSRTRTSVSPPRRRFCRSFPSRTCSNARIDWCRCCSTRISSSRRCC